MKRQSLASIVMAAGFLTLLAAAPKHMRPTLWVGYKVSESAPEYRWTRVFAEKEGNWPRWNYPVLAFGGEIWAAQDAKRVWHSPDGTTWTIEDSNGGWGERYRSRVAYFKGKLWLAGGSTHPLKGYRNDIWVSENGTGWKLAVAHAPWQARAGHTMLAFQDRLWVIGGYPAYDAWSSSDGVNWNRATSGVPWSERQQTSIAVFDGKLWATGVRDDPGVWVSGDGVRWSQATPNAGWDANTAYKTLIAFDGKLWAMGGSDDRRNFKNDVWVSENGVRWKRVTEHAPWSPRAANFSVVFGGKLWLFAGKGGDKRDVWTMESFSVARNG